MKKKIFIVSKIYDTERMTDEDIRIAVQADIDKLIKREGVVEFEIIRQAKEIDLVFYRGLEYPDNKLQQGLIDRKSTRLNSSHTDSSRMPSSA